ncbi:MAG: hypothetical protein J6A01_11940 [Proteobacteria bacterium]|nr:hypothetical protein [Pseudomonadota bacterium]
MNDINDIHPGKLKRKARKSSSASVVDLPKVSASTTGTGNLMGDVFLENEIPELSQKGDASSMQELESEVVFKPSEAFEEPSNESPLDQLRPELKDEVSEPESTSSKDSRPVREVKVPPEGINTTEYAKPHRLQKKAPKTMPSSDEQKTPDASKLQDLFDQIQATNQECLDTLAKLQITNAQNERRYAMYLTLGGILIVVIIVIALVVGMQLRNSAKYNELKFKHEAYENVLKAKEILEAEFDKEKRGSAAAFEVYQKIEQGLFEESVERFTAIRNELTHPAEIALLESKIDDIQWKLAENAYHDGVMLFNASNFEQARDAFFKSLSHKENTSYSPRLYYYLAMSLYQLSDFEGARRYFGKINAADLSAEMDATARFYRGISAEKLGDEAEAFEQFDGFLKKYRYHRLADEATKHRAKNESGKRQ